VADAVLAIVQVLVFVVGSVVLALLGAIHVRRRVPLEVQMEQNEVAGFFIAVLGVVYGVLLASAVIAVWEDFENARDVAEREANAVGDIYRLADGMPDALRQPVQEQLSAYARSVVDEEWPRLREGQQSQNSVNAMDSLWGLLRQFDPSGSRQEALYAKLLDQLQQVNDERRMRLLNSREGIPSLMWAVLIGGGIVTVLFTYFFGLKNVRAQLAMTALYVASIGFVLFLIAAIQYPYSGAVSIRPEAMEMVLQRMEQLEAARR
jgi:hypothetical protein